MVKPGFSPVEVLAGIGALAVVLTSVLTHRHGVLQSQLTAAAFQSPLPDVRVAEEKLAADATAYRQAYDFSVDWFTHNISVWRPALARWKGKPGVHYLEIGSYEGRSAVWMLENILTDPTATLTAIDVFDGPYTEKYVANINRTGAAKKVTTITDFSQHALRELQPDSYDIIYIDGSHAKQDVLEDAVLSWRLLKEGGLMIFDDYRWAGCFVEGTSDRPSDFPKTAIDAFVACFGDQLEVIHNSYQILVRKKVQGSV
jgi:predicted O-methyltransferase YrrM